MLYTLNKWFMGLIANNRCLFQEWFKVRLSHLNHATTNYLLEDYPFIDSCLLVLSSKLDSIQYCLSSLAFQPDVPISVSFHVFANPLLNMQYIFVHPNMVVNIPVLSTFTIFISWSWVIVRFVERWLPHLPYISFVHNDKLV